MLHNPWGRTVGASSIARRLDTDFATVRAQRCTGRATLQGIWLRVSRGPATPSYVIFLRAVNQIYCVGGAELSENFAIFAEILKGMSQSLRQTTESIRAKCLILTQRYEKLIADMREADATIRSQRAEIEHQKSEIERLSGELRALKLATAIAPTADDRRSAREVLTGLVREIDQCINDLTH